MINEEFKARIGAIKAHHIGKQPLIVDYTKGAYSLGEDGNGTWDRLITIEDMEYEIEIEVEV